MMRLIATLWRARSAEVEEAVFDANAIRLLQQNLREATQAFEIAKYELARVMAQETTEARLAAELAERVHLLEEDAGKALSANDNSRAEMLAGRIAVLEDERAAHLETSKTCGREARRIREQVDQAARRIAEVKRGLSTAMAVDALQRTRGRLSGLGLGEGAPGGLGAIREAETTLKRIRERQQGQEDVSEAMAKLEGELPVAGARHPDASLRRQTDPKDVLARLKRNAPPPAA
jgi:phage shock protein A